MRSEELAQEWLDWLKHKRGRVPVTTYGYASTLAQFIDHLGTTDLASVSLPSLEAFCGRLRRYDRYPRPATISKDVAVIRSFYDYLFARGHIARNPALLLHGPKVQNQNPKPIPDGDWIKMWEEADPGPERVALGLGFFVGLRRREICELTPEQVFTVSGRLIDFKRKGGGEDVTPYADMCKLVDHKLPMLHADEFPDVLLAHVEKRRGHGYLIEWGQQTPATARETQVHALPPGMTDPQIVNRRMTTLCERAGVPAYTPHQLRHSTATNLLRCDVPLPIVQRLMNHSSPTVTMRYLRAGANELREWMRANGRI